MSELLVLGCSSRKTKTPGKTPALHRYDGPFFQDFRLRLRTHLWPDKLDVAVLSAEYGIIGALTEIADYDRRMTPQRALELAPSINQQTAQWTSNYDRIHLCLGKNYLAALPTNHLEKSCKIKFFQGPIGLKRQQLGRFLRSIETEKRLSFERQPKGRVAYFLPDWDDLIDSKFDFIADKFSATKKERSDIHCARLMRPYKIADGILVSLAQTREAKGPLKYVGGLETRTMKPISLRSHYGLDLTQALFGDCGAFSYVNEKVPPISVDYAVSMYDLYNFDFGASVDHIPVPFIHIDGEKVALSERERRYRVRLTAKNADEFLVASNRRQAGFVPVGTVQGLSPKQFARNANLYVDMGYQRIALGGLVSLSDSAVFDIVSATMASLKQRKKSIGVHLFGVFRPKLQARFRGLGVASFDSATYFRKAWLRSGQNYVTASGEWYTAVRVPMTSDGRTRNTMMRAGHDLKKLEMLEANALNALHDYGQRKTSLRSVLSAVIAYDSKLERSSEDRTKVASLYERTLEDRPWEYCPCPICKKIGIDVLIFRGLNRNKRRGTHNTWHLYKVTRNAMRMSFKEALEIEK